jgi:small subunit ribosomal protein S1
MKARSGSPGALSGTGGIQLLEDAHCKRIQVEGKVKETCKDGFSVEAMRRKAFYPGTQMDVKFVETPENCLGETLLFSIARTENHGRNIFLSMRKLLEQVQQKARKNFFNSLTVGTVLTGTLTWLKSYGAFLELIAGVVGMLHISEPTWSRVRNPKEIVKSGDTVQGLSNNY